MAKTSVSIQAEVVKSEINDSTEHRTQSQNNPALLSNEDDGTRVQNVPISVNHSFED